MPYADQLFCMRVGQRLEQYSLKDTKDNRVRTNTNCPQRDESDGREERRPAESAQNLSQLIVDHCCLSFFAGVRPSR